VPHRDPDDPPRRRGAKVRGTGNWDNDRPPVIGVVGRASGRVRLRVAPAASERYAVPAVRAAAPPGAAVSTDESSAYARLPWDGYAHATVAHRRKEWARDDDGDGVREVHCNTLEGLWAGLRTFLRPFRGVSKWHLEMYVAIFQWIHTIKTVTGEFIRALLGHRPPTNLGP